MKVIDCTQQLQVRENVVGFEKALGAVKVIKDQIQYRSQSLLNLASGYFIIKYIKDFEVTLHTHLIIVLILFYLRKLIQKTLAEL